MLNHLSANAVVEVKIHAERRMGELLAQQPKAMGELKRGPVVEKVDRGETPPTLR